MKLVNTVTMDDPDKQQTPRRRRPGYPDVAEVEAALAMLAGGNGYHPGPPMPGIAAPQATEDFQIWLLEHRPFPTVAVKCTCGWRLGKWKVMGHHVMPDWERPKRFGTSGAVAYTEAVAAGKGSIKSSYTADARGTITYKCKKCGRDIPLRCETRMRHYLEALADNSALVVI